MSFFVSSANWETSPQAMSFFVSSANWETSPQAMSFFCEQCPQKAVNHAATVLLLFYFPIPNFQRIPNF